MFFFLHLLRLYGRLCIIGIQCFSSHSLCILLFFSLSLVFHLCVVCLCFVLFNSAWIGFGLVRLREICCFPFRLVFVPRVWVCMVILCVFRCLRCVIKIPRWEKHWARTIGMMMLIMLFDYPEWNIGNHKVADIVLLYWSAQTKRRWWNQIGTIQKLNIQTVCCCLSAYFPRSLSLSLYIIAKGILIEIFSEQMRTISNCINFPISDHMFGKKETKKKTTLLTLCLSFIQSSYNAITKFSLIKSNEKWKKGNIEELVEPLMN